MKIALAHFRVGETDGVSLEMDKWAAVLEKMGHTVVFIAGSRGNTLRQTFIIDELYYKSKKNAGLSSAFYCNLGSYSEESLKKEILQTAETIEAKLIDIIKKQGIDMLVPNNIFSLGHDVAAAIGFMAAIKKTGVGVVCHHHDFWWEPSRPQYFKQTTRWGQKVMDNYFVPRIDNSHFRHCVINSLAQKEFSKRYGINSVVVPNVFDFSGPPWQKDDYNSTFRSDLGLLENEILILQATRVTNRKAIELAADVVALLNTRRYIDKLNDRNRRFVLAIVGLHEGIDGYVENLIRYIGSQEARVVINDKLVEHTRRIEDGRKIYSLWDAYVYADLITYPSIQEGWGNQFLESVFARVPIVLFEYDVYRADIGVKGFDVLSLGARYDFRENGLVCVDSKSVERVCDGIINLINNQEIARRMVQKNYELGSKYFSLEKLEEILYGLFNVEA
ncbi:MAG: glycosyltransferase family 4 protein [Clostridiaceae bacterium]|jgi:glycosyltransferase involved in cell wall biosynthesis|nr:glycosyltransferase family 4 protein [Clostridiaceae bacterium]